jgi:hypothetical protein
MSETPILKLPELAPAQAQPEVKVNAGWRAIEVVCQLRVLSRVASLPGVPADGDRYILTAADEGGAEHDVAYYSGGWKFITPETGWAAFVVDEATRLEFIADVWIEAAGGGAGAYDPLNVATVLDPGASLSFDTTGFDEDTSDVFLTPDDAGSSFQRLTVTEEGHRFWLWNASAVGVLTIEHDAGGIDECFLCPNAEDFDIPPLGGVLILRQDDTGVQRWRVGAAATGSGGGGGGGSSTFSGVMVSTTNYLTWTDDAHLGGWNVTEIDTDSYFDQFTDAYRFTVPSGKTGTFVAGFNITLTNSGDGSYRRLIVRKNGSSDIVYVEHNADVRSIQHAQPVELAAGDYIELFVQHDASGTVQTDPVNIGRLPSFYLYYLGA